MNSLFFNVDTCSLRVSQVAIEYRLGVHHWHTTYIVFKHLLLHLLFIDGLFGFGVCVGARFGLLYFTIPHYFKTLDKLRG